MKRGLTFVFDLRTEPMIWPLWVRGEVDPFLALGWSNVPISLLFAHPMVGFSKNNPRCEARPNPLGCAMPWPSIIKISGVFFNFSTAFIHAGASLNESRPGIYGILTFSMLKVISMMFKSGRLRTTAAAIISEPLFKNAQSRPAMSLILVFIGVNFIF